MKLPKWPRAAKATDSPKTLAALEKKTKEVKQKRDKMLANDRAKKASVARINKLRSTSKS